MYVNYLNTYVVAVAVEEEVHLVKKWAVRSVKIKKMRCERERERSSSHLSIIMNFQELSFLMYVVRM